MFDSVFNGFGNLFVWVAFHSHHFTLTLGPQSEPFPNLLA